MKRLCVLGSLHLDVIVNTDHIPQTDETVAGSNVNYIFGGKGGNQALAADSLGANVYFIGRIGSDAFGKILSNTLYNSSIDISQLQRDEGSSGMSVAIIDKKGDYGAVIVSESNLRIDKSEFLISKDTGILLLQNEVTDEVNVVASRKAIKVGAKVWLNAAPAKKISKELLKNLDLLVVNRPEGEFYRDLLRSNESSHIIKIFTFGAEGLKVQFPDKQPQHHDAYSIKEKSAHGAGDMFVGALAAHYIKNNKFSESLNYAQAAAAIKVSRNVNETTPIKEQDVIRFIQNH